jgi:hypothetical protein
MLMRETVAREAFVAEIEVGASLALISPVFVVDLTGVSMRRFRFSVLQLGSYLSIAAITPAGRF